MKKLLLLIAVTLFVTQLNAKEEMFTKSASAKPTLIQQGGKKNWCCVCGMSLKKFYKTSHATDNKQFCSIRCLVVDSKEHNHSTQNIRVVDAKTEKLIDAKSAYYVINSNIKGTMSKISKLAFANQKDAKAFASEHEGEVVDFKKALDLAKKSLESDIAMIAKKKQKKMYPMGKKLFEAKCKQSIELSKYSQINELKSAIINDKLCKGVKGMRLHALSLYLWEVKRAKLSNSSELIKVAKDEKWPVCGMFTYKYPKWVAQIFYGKKHYSFDGVKDMIKFYFNPMEWGKFEDAKKESISKILVTDYYSQKAIDGKKALYVIGSDILGPMGDELIPFKEMSDAQNFMDDHAGKKIISFDKISQEEIRSL